jgi:hypothetical protein
MEMMMRKSRRIRAMISEPPTTANQASVVLGDK